MPRGSKPGPRPHTWIWKEEPRHSQHLAWMRAKAQANFRGETWELTFEDFCGIWDPYWHNRGRAVDNVCLCREDPTEGWTKDNSVIMTRLEHLQRQRLFKDLA